VDKHRSLDRMLYDFMPATFAEFRSYPLDDKATKEVGKTMTKGDKGSQLANTQEQLDPVGVIMKEFMTPFFQGRMMSPMMDDDTKRMMEGLETFKGWTGGIRMEEEGNKLKYTVDISGFNPDIIKMTLIGDELRIEAREEKHEKSEGLKRDSSREMFKRILVPHGIQKDDITTQLSDQGELVIEMMRPEAVPIEIQQRIPLGQDQRKKEKAELIGKDPKPGVDEFIQ